MQGSRFATLAGWFFNNMPLTEVRNEYGFELHPVALQGREIAKKYSLPTDREATIEEVLHCPNSFFQLLAIDDDSNRIASFSFGLAAREAHAEDIFRAIINGTNNTCRWFGNDQLTAFIEDDIDPMELVRRMIVAPIPFYEQMDGLKAQADVQRMREEQILGQGSTGELIEEIFYDRLEDSVRAYNPKNRDSFFIWDYVVRGDQIWALDMDNQPESMTTLALDRRVKPTMRANLLAVQKFFADNYQGRRFVIKMNFDETVEPCCGAATNAQMSETNFHKTFEFESESKIIQKETNILFSDLLVREMVQCSNCKQPKMNGQNHVCQKDQKDKEKDKN